MVEAGQIEIGGTINAQAIEAGLTRVESGLEGVGTAGKSVNADFVRMNQQASRLGKTLGVLALTGVTAMVGIAKNAPATAGAMARIKVEAGKLQRTLGQALKPAFEDAAEAFGNFVDWITRNSEKITFFYENTLGGVIDALQTIKNVWEWVKENVKSFTEKIGIDFEIRGEIGKWLMKHFGPEIVGALIGGYVGAQLGGPAGMAVGAGVGAGTIFLGRRAGNIQLFLEEAIYGGLKGLLISMGRKGLFFNIGNLI